MSGRSPAIKDKPLSGVRVLVGRARKQASVLSEELRALGAEVIEIPFIEIRKPHSFRAMDAALKNLSEYDWLVLTSVNGVEAMMERLKKLRLPPWKGRRLRIAAIGPATKNAIERRGVKVDVVPREYVAESVVKSLKSKVKGKRVLLLRAKIARDVIPRELHTSGAHVDVVEVYETVVPQTSRRRLSSLFKNSEQRPHVVTFTSSSTVRNFIDLLGGPRPTSSMLQAGDGGREHLPHSVLLASIGPVTSSTLHELGLRADVEAKEFTIPGLVRVIVAAVAAGKLDRET